MVVDGTLASVESTNFDNRSFTLNDETTPNIVDIDFARVQTAVFEADLAVSRQLDCAACCRRPLRERFAEELASLPGSQL